MSIKLVCYPTTVPRLEIRPAPVEREWMNATSDRFAYRCLPLNIANTHGWEILCPFSFAARWMGGSKGEDIQFVVLPDNPPAPQVPGLLGSHFGSGVLTFQTGHLFQTEPEYNLWFAGPTNCPKDGIFALTGVVESDWAPYGVTMNWRFTRANSWVVFRRGEPFCLFFPIERSRLARIEPELRDLSSQPELKEAHEVWCKSRAEFNKNLEVRGSDAQKQKWQKEYFQGKLPDGQSASVVHETRLKLAAFVDRSSVKMGT